MQEFGRPFTRQDLERMKRVDIQRICKDYGVKANMKTEALIDLLLDTVRSNISPLVQPPRPPQRQPQPQPAAAAPATRRASTRSRTASRTSTRTRGTSGSSIVIHDTEDESQAEESSTTQVAESVASSSRIRKAKDTQLRLGVGRPVIAGGQGARAVTRTTSVAKGKRTRVSTISRPVEETIEEEPEFSTTDPLPATPPVNETASSSASDQHVNTRIEKLESLLNDMNLKQQYQTLKEATAQIDWLKTSLQQREMEIMNIRGELQACRVEVMVLRNETAKIPTLENQLRAVKENFDRARECNAGSPSKTQATRRVSIPLAESNTNSLLPAPSILPPPALAKAQMPGPTETMLGKRHRNSSSSNMTGVSESGEGGSMSGKDLTKRVLRPSRKRTRTDELTNPVQSTNPSEGTTESEGRSPVHDSTDDSGTGSSAPSTVPPIGTPPPTNHLPQYFGSSVDAEQQHTPKNYEHYPTDGGLLGFSFSHAASSTPRDDVFGYIDEPFSPGSALRAGVRPTAGTSNNGRLHPGPFGDRLASPSPSPRPRTPTHQNLNSPSLFPQYGGSPLQGMDETTDYVFQFTDPERRESSGSSVPLPIALGYGYNAIMGVPPLDDSPARPMQRTMYGTEVQNDTRFGEFGRDGIAGSSNWLNAGLFS